jgi:hypothetical protein
MEASETQELKYKAYRAKHDVSFPRVIAKVGEGDRMEYVTEGTNYAAGSVILHDDLPPHVQKGIEDGSLDHLVEPLEGELRADEVEAVRRSVAMGEPEFGVFVAEHEAEAHALEQYGHAVVPKDQELELLSSSEDYHRQYMDQVKEHGMDRRPNQEATSPENRQRIPDEMLAGGGTRSGLPYNQGPVQVPSVQEENPEEGSGEAARPAPPVEGEQAGQEAQ